MFGITESTSFDDLPNIKKYISLSIFQYQIAMVFQKQMCHSDQCFKNIRLQDNKTIRAVICATLASN